MFRRAAAYLAVGAQQAFGQVIGIGHRALGIHHDYAHGHGTEQGVEQGAGLVFHAAQGGVKQQAFDFARCAHGDPERLTVVGRGRAGNVETAPEMPKGRVDGRCGTAPGLVTAAKMLFAQNLGGNAVAQGQADGVGAYALFRPYRAGAEVEVVRLAVGFGHGDEQAFAPDLFVGPAFYLSGQLGVHGGLRFHLAGRGKFRTAGHERVHTHVAAAPPGIGNGLGQAVIRDFPGADKGFPCGAAARAGRAAGPEQRGRDDGAGHGLRSFVTHFKYVAVALQYVHAETPGDHSVWDGGRLCIPY